MGDLYATVNKLHASLDYHLFRHNLLAANLAQVDTPGYVPKDVSPDASADFGGTLSVAMASASKGASLGTNDPQAMYSVFEDPSPSASGLDKNSVSLDREAAKVAANQIHYDVVSVLASSELGDLHYAATDGRG